MELLLGLEPVERLVGGVQTGAGLGGVESSRIVRSGSAPSAAQSDRSRISVASRIRPAPW